MDCIVLLWLCLATASSLPLHGDLMLNSTDLSSGLKALNRNINIDLGAKENLSESSTTELPVGFNDLADLNKAMKDKFPTDYNIDYDSMTGPEPEKLVKDANNETFPTNGLAFKQMHERAQFMRIAEVKQSLLSKLRLLAPPNMTALKLSNKLKRYPAHILPSVLDDREMLSDDTGNSHEEDYHAKISTVIQFATDCKYILLYSY